MKATFHYTGQANEAGNSILSAVYRLVLETLNNTIQHARASQAHIELHQKQQFIAASVKDFDTSFTNINNHSSGLGSMRERVKMLDGSIQIEASPGSGTCVTISIPVKTEIASSIQQ